MSEEMQLAETLADLCIGRLNGFWGFKESAAFAFSALEVLPKDQQGPFALDLLQRVKEWKDYRSDRPVEVELVLWKAIAYEFMYATDLARMEAAAEVLLAVNLSEPFEEMFKRALDGYSEKDPTWRMLRLVSLAGPRRTPAFKITVHALIKREPWLIVEMAGRNWKKYRK